MNRLTTTDVPLPGTRVDPRYPDSDGRFMGETDYHNLAMGAIRETLANRYADDPAVYVTSNVVWYFEEGNPKGRKDPDILVAKKVRGKHRRRSFRAWEEKVVPCVLFEIASKDTWRTDLGEKRHLYARLGVKEYFVFDPEGPYLDPVLQGFKTVKGQSVPLKAAADGSLTSKELGLLLLPEGETLSLTDLKTGQRCLSAADRAEQEKQRAEQEKQRAEQEKQRAEALEAEVERLRALLDQQKHSSGSKPA